MKDNKSEWAGQGLVWCPLNLRYPTHQQAQEHLLSDRPLLRGPTSHALSGPLVDPAAQQQGLGCPQLPGPAGVLGQNGWVPSHWALFAISHQSWTCSRPMTCG